jgi:hypothetical protein
VKIQNAKWWIWLRYRVLTKMRSAINVVRCIIIVI